MVATLTLFQTSPQDEHKVPTVTYMGEDVLAVPENTKLGICGDEKANASYLAHGTRADGVSDNHN